MSEVGGLRGVYGAWNFSNRQSLKSSMIRNYPPVYRIDLNIEQVNGIMSPQLEGATRNGIAAFSGRSVFSVIPPPTTSTLASS
jgi:hypothetical protein